MINLKADDRELVAAFERAKRAVVKFSANSRPPVDTDDHDIEQTEPRTIATWRCVLDGYMPLSGELVRIGTQVVTASHGLRDETQLLPATKVLVLRNGKPEFVRYASCRFSHQHGPSRCCCPTQASGDCGS